MKSGFPFVPDALEELRALGWQDRHGCGFACVSEQLEDGEEFVCGLGDLCLMAFPAVVGVDARFVLHDGFEEMDQGFVREVAQSSVAGSP